MSGGIVFSGSGGDLVIDSTTMPTTTISNFTSGDTIDLAGISFDPGDTVSSGGGHSGGHR